MYTFIPGFEYFEKTGKNINREHREGDKVFFLLNAAPGEIVIFNQLHYLVSRSFKSLNKWNISLENTAREENTYKCLSLFAGS